MSIALVDFSTHPYMERKITDAQQAASDMSDKDDVALFVQVTIATLFGMLQCGYTDLPRPIAEAVLSYKADNFFIGRHGVRELTSTWAKQKFPKAKYETLITLTNKDNSIVHTVLIYI